MGLWVKGAGFDSRSCKREAVFSCQNCALTAVWLITHLLCCFLKEHTLPEIFQRMEKESLTIQ